MLNYETPYEDSSETQPDEFAADLPEAFHTVGWAITIGDDLPSCQSEVLKEGKFVCISPLDKGRTEQAVIATRHNLPGVLVDWCWIRNKAVVKCARGEPTVVKKAFLEHCHQAILKRIIDNDAMERRAEAEGKPFNSRWERAELDTKAA